MVTTRESLITRRDGESRKQYGNTDVLPVYNPHKQHHFLRLTTGLTAYTAGEAKIGDEKQSRRSNSKYNFMKLVFFDKGIGPYGVQWGLRQSPQKLGSFENFSVKSNLTVCNVTFIFTFTKGHFWGMRMYYSTWSSNNFVGGAADEGRSFQVCIYNFIHRKVGLANS